MNNEQSYSINDRSMERELMQWVPVCAREMQHANVHMNDHTPQSFVKGVRRQHQLSKIVLT